ncbi:2-hydroxycyclohexanecarboxyl-CoA dehydrogenase [Pseudothauera rhizosphaerae]|uniref:2-hydroxycyclohexanecarboxyl-CoA dehydrogenase n=1 Tax=Pseudothauera rhizosphaerae TaxID=2565932 RepID=A0A4S4AJR8_9RHOO|nr:2-hydroxycyclohexanecarboxyl-CoA dehydrogenase [Pseudothauera rhizosphaerae]THF59258.1 2-hydroxycyclohexanecarboxyl-CoA dehydrogenase [Pseudothauera rhizosphaerae]
MKGIKGKTVIVTGGGGGIGSAICRRFAEDGAAVAVFDIARDAAEGVAAGIRDGGGKAGAFAVDLTSQESVIAAVAAAEAQLGPAGVLVNNAGWDQAGPFLKTDKALWEKIVAVNLYGALYMHHAVLAGMAARGAGRVINVASDAARVGSSGEAVYAFCKGGLVAFSKTMARELARKRINVNVVCPGPTDTALFRDFAGEGEQGEKLRDALTKAIPFGRLGQPEDLPGIVAFLASDEASFITGQVISVSGGLTMAG